MLETYFLLPLLRDSQDTLSTSELMYLLELFGSSRLLRDWMALRRYADWTSLRMIWWGGMPSPFSSLSRSAFHGHIPEESDHSLLPFIETYQKNPSDGLSIFPEITRCFFRHELSSTSSGSAIHKYLSFEKLLYEEMLQLRRETKEGIETGMESSEKMHPGKKAIQEIPFWPQIVGCMQEMIPVPAKLETLLYESRIKWLKDKIVAEEFFSFSALVFELALQIVFREWKFWSLKNENIRWSQLFCWERVSS